MNNSLYSTVELGFDEVSLYTGQQCNLLSLLVRNNFSHLRKVSLIDKEKKILLCEFCTFFLSFVPFSWALFLFS